MYYPVYLDLEGRRCVVVGGGRVAERKVETLLEHGANVFVIGPELTPNLAAKVAEGLITHVARAYQSGDLEGAWLVFCATDDRSTNAAVFREAQARGVTANVIDDPELCNFIVPSIVARGDLQIAISTGGASPALAKRIRLRLEGEFGPEYAILIGLLGDLRERVMRDVAAPSERKRILGAVADSDLLERIRAGADITVEDLVAEFVTEG